MFSVTPDSKRHRAFTLMELLIVVLVLGLLAATATQLYDGYIRRSKTQEVYLLLPRIADGQVVYFQENGTFIETGPTNIPPSVNRVQADFSADNWPAIRFAPAGSIQYGYQCYRLGAEMICEAQGDLDGDGNVSIFSIRLTPQGQEVTRSSMFIFDELE